MVPGHFEEPHRIQLTSSAKNGSVVGLVNSTDFETVPLILWPENDKIHKPGVRSVFDSTSAFFYSLDNEQRLHRVGNAQRVPEYSLLEESWRIPLFFRLNMNSMNHFRRHVAESKWNKRETIFWGPCAPAIVKVNFHFWKLRIRMFYFGSDDQNQ